MTTTISGTVTMGVGLDPTTQSNPVIVTGTIADPNNSDAALSGGGQVWTIVNQGVILETGTAGYGIRFLSGGDITNSGTIGASGVGIALSTTGTVNNSGTIFGLGGAAIVSNNIGTVSNAFGGLIQGAGAGVEIFDVGTVSNYGSIIATGSTALPAVRIGNSNVAASSIVVNGTPGSSAFIIGPGGVAISGTGTLTNFGSIVSTDPIFGANYAYGVNISGTNSSLTNGAAGSTNASILSFNLGVAMSGGAATLTNFGTISANGSNGTAVDMLKGGSVLNGTVGSTSALIQGSVYGVSRATTVINFATIVGTTNEGIVTGQAATIVNGASGVTSTLILGKGGISVGGTTGTLTNFGTVLGTGDVGANFAHNAVVSNGQAGSTLGLIQGSQGINIASAGTIANFGTIIGTAGRGVFVGGGGTLVNGSPTDAGRQIIGTSDGVQFFIYVPATIHNFGTILATATNGVGASVRAGGNIVNGTAGSTSWLISGGALGISSVTNLTNYGTISGAAQAGVEYGGGGAIVNAAGALITGANGVFDAALSVTNAGTIIATAGNGNGVHLSGTTGLVSNSGTIQAGYRGVTFDHAGTLINTGTITAASQQGVFFSDVGSVSNAAGKSIIGSNYGVEFFISGAGTVTNTGTISATATTGIGLSLRAGGTATNNAGGLIQGPTQGVALSGTGGVVTNFGTIAGTTAVYIFGANDRLIAGGGAVFGGTLRASGSGNVLEVSGAQASTLRISGFTNLQFDAGASGTVEGSAAGLPGAITGFAAGDTIDLDGFVAVSDTYTGSALILTDAASNHATLGIQGSFATSDFKFFGDGHGGTDVTTPCFCRGTRVLTARGEVAVEDLQVGDRAVTLSGALKPVVWIGMGRDLVTRANKLARPVIVRQGALADGVPHRDLHLTHGHALYLDSAIGGVLIPVEHLVNHKTIRWDERAQVVEYYHIELDDHDVLLAEGAPAESYHDAGNRAAFQNTRPGSTAAQTRPTFAAVLHGGEVVEAVWARLLARAGGPAVCDMTADPDLHLVVDGGRIEPEMPEGGVYRFLVPRPPIASLLLRSRVGVPSLLGQGRSDHRPLGVAITQLTIEQEGVATWLDYDQPQLREAGCYRHEDGFAWTDGELHLPARFFPPLAAPFTLLVRTEPHPELRYPLAAAAAQAA